MRCLFSILFVIILYSSCQAENTGGQQRQSQQTDSVASRADTTDRVQAVRAPNFEAAGLAGQKVRSFFDSLKQAVRSNDKQAIAGMIAYPCNVTGEQQSFKIKSKEEFMEKYKEVWGEDIREAILSQTFEGLFVNYQGVRVGRGEVWFSGVWDKPPAQGGRQRIRIIALNHF